ncbi:MAG TPA: DUF2844 domain-containing protein [Vicinamibacterales bacterium]
MTSHSRFLSRAAVAVALGAVLGSSSVSASLGGAATSVQDDRVHMQGSLRQISGGPAYSMHELQSATGTVVREYVSPTGTVFAVSWDGPAFPDLRQLLGPYFDRFQAEAARLKHARRGHGPLTVDLGDVVVQSGGHPRSFSGRAYLPQMMPAGVKAESIR